MIIYLTENEKIKLINIKNYIINSILNIKTIIKLIKTLNIKDLKQIILINDYLIKYDIKENDLNKIILNDLIINI